MGKPYRNGVVTKNAKQFNTLTYAFASTSGESLYKGVTPARSQGFIFYNDILVEHEFASSWKEDHTEFDNSKIVQITENVSRRNDVISIIGKPTGRYTYPFSINEEGESLVYMYNHTKGSAFNLKFYNKVLIVEINREGIVTTIDFSESEDK